MSLDCSRKYFDAKKCGVCVTRQTTVTTLWAKSLDYAATGERSEIVEKDLVANYRKMSGKTEIVTSFNRGFVSKYCCVATYEQTKKGLSYSDLKRIGSLMISTLFHWKINISRYMRYLFINIFSNFFFKILNKSHIESNIKWSAILKNCLQRQRSIHCCLSLVRLRLSPGHVLYPLDSFYKIPAGGIN